MGQYGRTARTIFTILGLRVRAINYSMEPFFHIVYLFMSSQSLLSLSIMIPVINRQKKCSYVYPYFFD